MYLLIVFALLLTSCGSGAANTSNYYIDPELMPYVDDFTNEVGVKPTNVVIVFGDLESDTPGEITLGNCRYGYEVYEKITIDRKAWKNLSKLEREHLMYHEFGHCVLMIEEHNDEEVVDPNGITIEASIMNTYNFGNSWHYNSYNKKYKQALKNNANIKF